MFSNYFISRICLSILKVYWGMALLGAVSNVFLNTAPRLLIYEIYFLLILSEYLIHDYSNGAIAGYIAGGTETVHRNIEGYHKCLHISIET